MSGPGRKEKTGFMADLRKEADIGEVSVATTLRRTGFLVGLTVILMIIVRICPAVSQIMQKMAGSRLCQSFYHIFHIQGALGREQFLLLAITIACFAVALLVQGLGLWAIRRGKQVKRASGRVSGGFPDKDRHKR